MNIEAIERVEKFSFGTAPRDHEKASLSAEFMKDFSIVTSDYLKEIQSILNGRNKRGHSPSSRTTVMLDPLIDTSVEIYRQESDVPFYHAVVYTKKNVIIGALVLDNEASDILRNLFN